jgi:hypothetical protein
LPSGRKAFKSIERGLLFRQDWRLRNLRNAISATRSRFVSAVGNERLTLMKRDFPIGPKYLATHAIRNIDGAVAFESDDSRSFHIEIRVVSRHDRIVASRSQQFLGAFNTAGND